MRAFEVSVNGRRLTVAGIGERGVLTVIVCWNLEPPAHLEHLRWGEVQLSMGG